MATKKSLPLKAITSIEDVVKFFAYLMKEEHLNFHADTPFSDYVGEKGKPTYTKKEAAARSALLDECFKVCKRDLWDIHTLSIRAYNEALAEYHNISFRDDLVNGKYKSSEYGYTIEKVNDGRSEYWELTIVTTGISELDGEEPGIMEDYSYFDKEEAEADIATANQYSTIEFQEV
jgi:hypothetical protein